jgi:hypothetical protein
VPEFFGLLNRVNTFGCRVIHGAESVLVAAAYDDRIRMPRVRFESHPLVGDDGERDDEPG